MLVLNQITKRFRGAEDYILRNISFTVNDGERIGLIGPNGCGKSTLLKIITGELEADSGSIQRNPPSLRIGYMAQGIGPETGTVEEILYPNVAAIHTAEEELEQLAAQLLNGSDEILQAYDRALQHLVDLSSTVDSNEIHRALVALELDAVSLDTPVQTLSGGQKTRLMLAALLVSSPQLLVLDEPTNHLDIVALDWLENWVRSFPGGVLIVSHDRAFLNNVINRVVAIDPTEHTARVFVGNYSDYLHTIQVEREKQWSQWTDQQDEIIRLRHDAERTMARAVRKENATKNDRQRRYAKKVAHKAKAKEKRLERYLASDERVEKPELSWQVKMEFDDISQIRSDAVQMGDLSVGYAPESPLLEGINLILRRQERVAIMGPNGHGKSTLLKTIIGEIPPLGGIIHIGGSVQVGYLAQEQDILDPTRNALETLQHDIEMTETEARSFLHFYLFSGEDSLRPVKQLSYGERSRLMLARLVAQGANLLVMDEPLNHLDLSSREKFEHALMQYPGSVLAVVHDRYFVNRFADTVWYIENGELQVDIRRVEVS